MLTAYNANYPRKWSEMSFDFKGMFVYHLSMMLMMISGQAVPAAGKITIACAIIAGVGVLSARRRRALGWRWRRPGFRAIATGMAGLIAVGFFLGSAIPLYSPFNPNLLPWYLAGLGIALFGLLISLHVSFLAEKDFLAACKGPVVDAAPVKSTEKLWRRTIRAAYMTAFILVWLDGVGSFYLVGSSFKQGSTVSTMSAPVPLQDHGHIAYVTADRKRLIDLMQNGMVVGIPIIIGTGLILQFFFGIRVLPNTPPRP